MNVHLLPGRVGNERSVASLQRPTVLVLHGASDPADRQVAHTNKRSNCTPACRACGCHRLRAPGIGNSGAGQRADGDDAIAGKDWLGPDDADQRITWKYAQQKGKPTDYGLIVEVVA